jgi:glycosyltransferase involved in cell wall biosynthesis
MLPSALKCDTFVMFSPAILPNYLYYPVLKRLGKRIVNAFWGSDIRYWYAFGEEMCSLGVYNEVKPFIDYIIRNPGPSYFDKLNTIRTAERYADLILSQPDYAQLQTRPYMRAHIPLDLSQYRFTVSKRETPLVLHAPSVRGIKGTHAVLKAVEQLKEEGLQFQFRLIEKMSNIELRELLSEADIVVDQLYSCTVATLSAEAMATGNAAITRYMPNYAKVPSGCPAINVNKDTLLDQLRLVIRDRDLRRKLAYAGRAYVESNNDHIKITKQILEWLKPGGIKAYDFVPEFYHKLKVPTKLLEDERGQIWQKRKHLIQKDILTKSRKNS